MSIDKKEDRRVRRTKKALREGLAELLMEKDIQHITVRELTEKADVNRSTFYANFKDVYDVHNQMENIIIQEINDILSLEQNWDAKTFFGILFQYVSENRQACRLISMGNINSTLVNRISALFKELCVEHWKKKYNLAYSVRDLDYCAQYLFSGSFGVISEWIISNSEYSTDEAMLLLTDIDNNFSQFIKNKFTSSAILT